MRARGFPLAEMKITIVLVALVAALAIPRLLHTQQSAQDVACVRNLLAARDGTLAPGATCPLGGQYAQRDEGGLAVVACPAPEPHLVARTRFVKGGEGWQELSGLAHKPLGEAEVSAGWLRSAILNSAPPRLETQPSGLSTYLIVPLLGLVWVAATLGLVGYALWTAKEIFQTDWERCRDERAGVGAAFVAWCVLSLPLGYGIAHLLRTEAFDLRPGEVRVQVSYPGYEGEAQTFPVGVVVPTRFGSNRRVVVLRADDPSESLELFTTGEERLDAIAFVHSVLRGS